MIFDRASQLIFEYVSDKKHDFKENTIIPRSIQAETYPCQITTF